MGTDFRQIDYKARFRELVCQNLSRALSRLVTAVLFLTAFLPILMATESKAEPMRIEFGKVEASNNDAAKLGAKQSDSKSDTIKSEKMDPAAELSPSPQIESSLQVFLPPVIEKSKTVWGSMYDAEGNNLAQQKLYVNGQEISCDDFGSFNFIAPSSETVTVVIPGTNGTRNRFEAKYTSTARGLLVADSSAADLVDRLDLMSFFSGGEPIISHAPSVVEELQTIVIVGKNFSGKQGEDDLEIGNRSADILAASTRSIVAVTNRQMKIGPIKEMRVSSHDQSSVPVELDICRIEVKQDTVSTGKSRLRINVMGSTLPAVVTLSNSSRKADLHFGGWRLGSQNIFLSPGGLQNYFMVDPTASVSDVEIGARIISNGIFDPYSMKASRSLLSAKIAQAEEEAEIIRLKKRAIGLEAQLNSVNNERSAKFKSGKLGVEEESKLDISSKSVSSRLFRIEKMLQARRAVIESYGTIDYDKLLDAAANNTLANLDGIVSTREIGFTESRLLKIVAKRAAEEQKQAQAESAAWTYNYTSPSSAVLEKYRKKYGKRGYVPPPPSMALLVPPPVPYRPYLRDLGPFLGELEKPKVHDADLPKKSKRGRRGPIGMRTASGQKAVNGQLSAANNSATQSAKTSRTTKASSGSAKPIHAQKNSRSHGDKKQVGLKAIKRMPD